MTRNLFGGDRKTKLSFDYRRIVEGIEKETENFPKEDRPGCGYWHMHLPAPRLFIDSPQISKVVRKVCIQTLVDRANHLYTLKPADSIIPTRVVVAITLPNLFDAQIIVFFGSAYFETFFDRDSSEQSWLTLSEHRSLVKEWGLTIPNNFSERGYREIIQDENFSHNGEVWFIGELDNMR